MPVPVLPHVTASELARAHIVGLIVGRVVLAVALAALGLALALCGPAVAHSWYPYACCADRDCWPMGEDKDAREPDPKIVPGGYLTFDGIFVAERDTRPSRDGRFHVCRQAGAREGKIVTPPQERPCLFVPRPTF